MPVCFILFTHAEHIRRSFYPGEQELRCSAVRGHSAAWGARGPGAGGGDGGAAGAAVPGPAGRRVGPHAASLRAPRGACTGGDGGRRLSGYAAMTRAAAEDAAQMVARALSRRAPPDRPG